jgi:hypothetical protein
MCQSTKLALRSGYSPGRGSPCGPRALQPAALAEPVPGVEPKAARARISDVAADKNIRAPAGSLEKFPG